MTPRCEPGAGRRKAGAYVAATVLTLTALSGCGGGGDSSGPGAASASSSAPASPSASPSTSPSTSPSPSTSASASASPSTSTASVPTSPAAEAFAPDQLSGLHDLAYDAANKERAKKDRYFATDPARVAALLDTVAARVPEVVTSHPAGATVHLAYVIAPYDSSQLTCAPDDKTLEFLMVVGKDGIAFTTIVSSNTGSSFRIFDSARAGQKPFDQDGFNVGSGGCAKTGPVRAVADRDIPLP